MIPSLPSIATHFTHLKEAIHYLSEKYDRSAETISLLAVSKGQSSSAIAEVFSLGQRDFGESYLQEALPKIRFFEGKNIKWHFIGTLQSNKLKKIAENFHWVHTLSSLQQAKRLADCRPPQLDPLNICLQINLNNENNQSGITPAAAKELAAYCLTLPTIRLRGLMVLPAFSPILNQQRANFSKLKAIYEDFIQSGFPLDTLSMGMSQDMEAAIAEGTTLLRIGTAIFGSRR